MTIAPYPFTIAISHLLMTVWVLNPSHKPDRSLIMLCVTGKEQDTDLFMKRVVACQKVDLHELRLDLLQRPEQGVGVLEKMGSSYKILATCRPCWAKGGYSKPEKDRLDLLRQCIDAGAFAIDVEKDTPKELLDPILASVPSGRILLSHHVFESSWTAQHLVDTCVSMRKIHSGPIKLAAMVEDVADLSTLLEIGRADQQLVLVPMGRAGKIGRVCYRSLGSLWTYVAASKTMATAEGQVCWEHLEDLRLGQESPLLVLLGGDQVHESFGPKIYNSLLRSHGLKQIYLPAETRRFSAALDTLSSFGLAGAAVTMPHKIDAYRTAHTKSAAAEMCGSVNTLEKCEGSAEIKWKGYNTDAGAVRACIEESGLSLEASRVLILGAGGAARAAAWALKRAKAHIALTGRTHERARSTAELLDLEFIPWSHRHGVSFDVLINATPAGSTGTGSPWEEPGSLKDKILLDMITNPPDTTLVKEALDAGAKKVLTGISMWVRQGMDQLAIWTKEKFTQEEIEERLSPFLGWPSR